MIWRNMGSNNTVLWILWSVGAIRIMLDGIMSAILAVLHRHIHLVLDIILTTVCTHLALISHVITATGRVRSLIYWRRWRNILISYFVIGVSTILLSISMFLASNRSTWHLSIARLLTSTWNLIRCVFVAILNSICSFYVFYILLDVRTMCNCLKLWTNIGCHFYWRSYNAVNSLIYSWWLRFCSTFFPSIVAFNIVRVMWHGRKSHWFHVDGLRISFRPWSIIGVWIVHSIFVVCFTSVVLILWS